MCFCFTCTPAWVVAYLCSETVSIRRRLDTGQQQHSRPKGGNRFAAQYSACAAQGSAAQRGAVTHSAAAAQRSAAQLRAVSHSAAQHSAAQCRAAQCSATQHRAAQRSAHTQTWATPASSERGSLWNRGRCTGSSALLQGLLSGTPPHTHKRV